MDTQQSQLGIKSRGLKPHVMIPPIDVEVSDESDMEDDELHTSPHKSRPYSQIAEEDEDEDVAHAASYHLHTYAMYPRQGQGRSGVEEPEPPPVATTRVVCRS